VNRLYGRASAPKPGGESELLRSSGQVQGLFEASPQLVIAQHQLVVVLQEVNPVSAPEAVDVPDARCPGKSIKIASALAVFLDFEIRKGLRLGHEDDADVAVIGAKAGLAFDCAVRYAAFPYPKNATQFTGKHAVDYEALAFEVTLQFHGVGVGRVRRLEQDCRGRTRRRLRQQGRLGQGKEQGKEQDETRYETAGTNG